MSPGGSKRCTGVDTGSTPRADRTEVDRLLHELRSTLARLKAELELSVADGQQADRRLVESVDDTLRILGSVEHAHRATSPTHVLVIDDDARLAAATARQLQKLGFSAQVLHDLSDIPIAPGSGTRAIVDLSVLRLAKKHEREQLRVFRPIVVSGSSDPVARFEADSYGGVDYLLKPVDPGLLRAALIEGISP